MANLNTNQAKKPQAKTFASNREIDVADFGLVVTVDYNDNIIKIVRKSDKKVLTGSTLPVAFYQQLAKLM